MAPLLNPRLFAPGDRVLVALSGGADSLSLLHLLVAVREELGLSTLAAVHVHHGMRGVAADADVRQLQEWCRAWGVPLDVRHADVPTLARERRISVEEAGRQARYAAFEQSARELGMSRVATAHTADDQVETVLFRLLRGTGTDGLAGIPEWRPLSPTAPGIRVVRPLLGAWRSEIEAYLAARGLRPLEDATNRDLRYQRSRLRYELLPLLEPYGPDVKAGLLRLAAQAREEAELLDALAADLLARARAESEVAEYPWTDPASRAAYLARPLSEAPPALTRRALRLALRQAGGWDAEVDRDLLERLRDLLAAPSGSVEIPGAPCRARRAGPLLRMEPTALPRPERPEVWLQVPGETAAPAWRLCVSLREEAPPASPALPALEAVWDAAAVHPPLRLRTPRAGDRFHPLNAPGSRLLSDLFADRKIPAPERAGWPVFEDAEGIVWVPGVAVAHRVRVREETKRCWRVRLQPLA